MTSKNTKRGREEAERRAVERIDRSGQKRERC